MGDHEDRPDDLELDVLGLRVTLRSSCAAVREAWIGLFEPFATPPGAAAAGLDLEIASAQGRWELRVEGTATVARPDWPELQPIVITEINRRAVERMPWFGVHAGVVGAGSVAIAFPGESGRGKSTAVAACVADGLSYVSDEALILAPGGRLVPYPRPISLSPEMAARLGMAGFGDRDEVAVTMAGVPLLPADRPAQLGHVVVLRRSTRAGARLVDLPRADAVIHLLANSFNHYRDPGGALRLTTEVARNAQCWELVYDRPEDVPRLLRELIST